jgi:hypothetical protein
MYPIIMIILILYYNLLNFEAKAYCTDFMYFYLICSVSYGVNQYLDLRNLNKFNSIQFSSIFFSLAQLSSSTHMSADLCSKCNIGNAIIFVLVRRDNLK